MPVQRSPRARRRRGLLLAALAVMLGLAGCEVLARLWFRANPAIHWRVNAESAWRLAWVARRQQGVEVYRPGVDRFDARLGWRNQPGFGSSEPILGSEQVAINSRGARGTVEVPHERAEGGPPRVVVIGDSFAFGWGVSDAETYAHVLGLALPGTQVVNLGVGGYGTDQMLVMLREEGLRYRPDLVLVGVVSADTERNLTAFRDFAKPRFVLGREGTLRLVGVPVPTPEEVLAAQRFRPRLLDLLDVARTALAERGAGRGERAERLTTALWTEIERESKAAGARTLFLFAPIADEMAASGPGPCEVALLAFGAAEGARVLSLGDDFRRRHAAGESFSDGHWGLHAHGLIAAELARAIREDRLLER